MILNYSSTEPKLCWPQVDRDYLSQSHRHLIAPGLQLLTQQRLSFDLQCNWFQLTDAAKVFESYPNLVVILNHMGCLNLGEYVVDMQT